MRTVTHSKNFHAFWADSILFTQPPPDTVHVGDTLYIKSNPYPLLHYGQERIEYVWHATPINHGGHFKYNFFHYWDNKFWSDSAGTFQLYYSIEDTVSGFLAESPHRTIMVRPKITITMPAVDTKFTFDDKNPGTMQITAIGTTDPANLANFLKWTITPIDGSNLTLTPLNGIGDTVIFSFTGLPANNNQFGFKYIKAELEAYGVVESVRVKTYFAKYEKNHPGLWQGAWPNWYYYWKQTIASRGRHVYGGQLCGLLQEPGYYLDGEIQFHVCAEAAEYWSVQCDGGNLHHGIDNFAETCIHENQHQTDYFAWWMPGGYDPQRDGDVDYVPDLIEPSLGYNPTMRDTDRDGNMDSEDHARDRECDWTRGAADTLDWGNPGHQY